MFAALPSIAQISEESLLRAKAIVEGIASSKEKSALYCEWSAESLRTIAAIKSGDLSAIEAHNAKANAAFARLGHAFDEALRTYSLSYSDRAELAKGLYDAWSELDRLCPGSKESRNKPSITKA